MSALPARSAGAELLDCAAIASALEAALAAGKPRGGRAATMAPPSIEVVPSIDSTNTALLERLPQLGLPHALLAEQQLAGRGRRGRRWNSAGSASLCLSLAWRSPRPLADCAPVGLVAGVACSSVLRACGAPVLLKWPNDLVADAAKLGGILVEARPLDGGTGLVVGLGLNLAAPASGHAADAAALPATALSLLPGVDRPDRSALAGRLLAALCQALREFDAGGFTPFRGAFADLDWLAGRAVTVHGAGDCMHGIARGVGDDGALLVEHGGALHPVRAGDVSVRPA